MKELNEAIALANEMVGAHKINVAVLDNSNTAPDSVYNEKIVSSPRYNCSVSFSISQELNIFFNQVNTNGSQRAEDMLLNIFKAFDSSESNITKAIG